MIEELPSWPERRFSQAISEGDGISLIPLVRGDEPELARAAAASGAEALAVESITDVELLRAASELPLLVRSAPAGVESLHAARAAGADAYALVLAEVGEGALLEELAGAASELGLDCAVEIRDEEELERALELVDPDVLIISARGAEGGGDDFERTLDLLSAVPVGKLVVAESRVATRDGVLTLERAGVDAILLAVAVGPATLAELTGRSEEA